MLFNSFVYIFLFLPVVLWGYYALNRHRPDIFPCPGPASRCWLAGASLFFYGYWNPIYLPLIIGSISVNFIIGKALGKPSRSPRFRKRLLITGVSFNLVLLGFFKYADFVIANLNALLHTQIHSLNWVLPLAISFFTFQQIAYLVDSYHQKGNESKFLNYLLFVSFFPQLIAGPIVHHGEMIPQFTASRNDRVNWEHLSRGLYLFSMGLFKKTVIADTLAAWANYGFGHPTALNGAEAWMTSLSYTLQLYFDFSGYTDMAIGAALMFNIKLPINFNSPYKSLNIQDFWRRWHITLGRFLRQYLYIPLGGNRRGEYDTCRNLMITFLLGGFWHGAGWTFIVWGALHGLGAMIHRQWQGWRLPMPTIIAWLLTFNFINAAWVLFRAANLTDAYLILKKMAALINIWDVTHGAYWSQFKLGALFLGESDALKLILFVGAGFLICICAPNSIALSQRLTPKWGYVLYITVLLCVCMATMFYLKTPSEFLYFQF